MYRGTTPTLPIVIPKNDLTAAKLFLTFQSGVMGKQITLTTPDDFTVELDGENTVGSVSLTQEQTLNMIAGGCSAQIRFVFPDGQAGVTRIRPISIEDVLYEDVIKYD